VLASWAIETAVKSKHIVAARHVQLECWPSSIGTHLKLDFQWLKQDLPKNTFFKYPNHDTYLTFYHHPFVMVLSSGLTSSRSAV